MSAHCMFDYVQPETRDFGSLSSFAGSFFI